MTSKKVEDLHVTMLDRLLMESGLECLRSLSVSEESSTLVGEEELEEEYEEEAIKEEAVKEEEVPPQPEAVPEELPYLFPTPSLRKVLPERIRKIQAQNRIHVLPEVFRTDIDPLKIPKIALTPPQKYIDILAEMVGCEMYKSSLAEYWFLDTLANLLRRAQEDNMHRASQAVLIQWFCEWMKQIQHFDAADRQRMMRRFEEIMLQAAQTIAGDDKLPTPREAHVSYKAIEEEELVAPTNRPRDAFTSPKGRENVVFAGTQFECCLKDLVQIMHYLFDLFSSDFQYNLVRSIFTFPPDYAQVEIPYQIQIPKRLFQPEKTKKKETKSPKKDKDKDKKAGKGGKKEVVTEEYLALMALKAREEREIEEREEMEREEWLMKSRILPLNFAAEDSLFDKYWPPPPPEPPAPTPPPPSEGKGKGKGKGGKGKK